MITKCYEILFANDLDQSPLLSLPIQLIVKDLLPRVEVQLTIRNGTYNLSSHDGPLLVCISIIFIPIMLVLAIRFLRSKLFKSDLIVLIETTFIVVDEYTGCYAHSFAEHTV